MRGPKFTLGALCPRTLPSEKIFIPENSTWPMEMCVKFRLSSSSSFRDMRGSHIYTRGRSHRPNGKIVILKRVLGPVETCVEFQLSSSSSFRHIRGSQIYPRGAAPHTPPSGRMFVPEKSTWPNRNVCKISTF